MITKFATVYPGPIDLPDMGQMATPANERRYSNEQLAGVFEKTDVVPGATPAQIEASARRGGWGAAGVPTVQHDMKTGAWFAGPPEELTAYLTDLESRYPGLEYVNVSISMGTAVPPARPAAPPAGTASRPAPATAGKLPGAGSPCRSLARWPRRRA